jgi:MFS family permease
MYLIIVLCVTILGNTFSIGSFPVVLPELGRVAGLPDWQLGVVMGAFGFARMLSDVPVGLFITHHLRRALVIAPLVIIAGALCLGAGGPVYVLVLGRALMGFGHSLAMVAALSTVLRLYGSRAGAALNAFEFSAMIGMLGGVALLGALSERLPWNLALLVTCTPLLIGVLALPLLLRALPRTAHSSTAAPLFARTAGPRTAARTRVPPLVVLSFVAGAAIAIAYSTVAQFMVPLRGSREFGLDRSGIARLLMINQAVDIVFLLPVGVVSDRRGARRILCLVLLILAAATTLVAFFGLPGMVAGCALFGLGMAGWMLPLSVLRTATPPEQLAWRTALYRVGVDAGLFLGPSVSGLLVERAAGALPGLAAATLAVLSVLLWRQGEPRGRGR